MKILVTGANGYIGTGVVEQLLALGHEVIAADFTTEHVSPKAMCMPCNLFELENPYEYFGQPDCVLHLAWRDGFKHASNNHLLDFPGHYAFLTKLIDGGLKHLTVLGSMHEIGFFEGSIKEDTPCNPQSLYGIAKNALRQALQVYLKAHPCIFQWIRGYYIVGNAQAGCSIFSKIAEAVKAGKTSFPFTMGTNQYDFLDYTEFCKQVAAVVSQTEIIGIINCCSGFPMTLKERVEQFIKENNFNIKLEYGAFPDRPYDSKAVWGDNTKITQILNKQKGNK